MRYFNLFLLTACLLSCCIPAIAQVQPSDDAALAARSRQLSVYLSLSPAQEQSLLAIGREQQHYMDSVTHAPSSQEQRRAAMIAELRASNLAMKSLLTPVQWKKYQDMLDAKRADFQKRNADKHIKVQELPGQ